MKLTKSLAIVIAASATIVFAQGPFSGLANRQDEIKNAETLQSQPKPSSSLAASTVSADEIIAKAEDHDGIVVGGFYLGMSPDDALVLCKHYFGHLGTVKLNKRVWGKGEYIETYEGIVLVKEDGAYQAICGIGKEQHNGPTQVEKMGSAKRVVNSFRFDSKMIRALIGQKKVMSTSELDVHFSGKLGWMPIFSRMTIWSSKLPKEIP